MKKKGSKCDYIESRNEILKREFLARVGRNGKTVAKVIESMSRVSVPRFYISEERAYAAMKRIYNNEPDAAGKGRGPMHRGKREMLMEIERRVKEKMETEPGLTLKDAVFEVVNSPAPAFYLTPASMRTIIYEILGRPSA